MAVGLYLFVCFKKTGCGLGVNNGCSCTCRQYLSLSTIALTFCFVTHAQNVLRYSHRSSPQQSWLHLSRLTGGGGAPPHWLSCSFCPNAVIIVFVTHQASCRQLVELSQRGGNHPTECSLAPVPLSALLSQPQVMSLDLGKCFCTSEDQNCLILLSVLLLWAAFSLNLNVYMQQQAFSPKTQSCSTDGSSSDPVRLWHSACLGFCAAVPRHGLSVERSHREKANLCLADKL